MAIIINKKKLENQQTVEKPEKKINIVFKDGEVYDLEKISNEKKRTGSTAISIGLDTENKNDGEISMSSKKEIRRISADDCKKILFEEE